MKKATALTVTVLAIATLAGTSVAQSAYSKALTSGQVAGTRIFNSQIGKNWGLPGAKDVYSARTALFSPDGQMLAIPTVAGIPIWQAFGN
jgi:hypothetical protein